MKPSFASTSQAFLGFPGAALLRRFFSVCWSRNLELLMICIGAALRISMRYRFDPALSFDSDSHWEMLRWIAGHHALPPVDSLLQAQHPPLYYTLAAWLTNHGVSRAELVDFSVAFGIARLAMIWLALELHLTGKRCARVMALALAAVIPASIHLDGMNYPEPLSGLLNACALVLIPYAFRPSLAARYRFCVAAGVIFGLAMLTKISAVACLGAIGVSALLELLLSGRPWRARVTESLGWALFLATVLSVCGWYFARNVRDFGQPFMSSFELHSEHYLAASYDGVPILDRRSVGFWFGWSNEIYQWPYYPSGLQPHPRFFPVALASTFSDYWNFSFAGTKRGLVSPLNVLPDGILPRVFEASRGSVIGGTVIALATLVAAFVALRTTLRRRDFGRLALVLVPLVTTAAALDFATKFPIDHYGVIKGEYMTFGAGPAYALFGLAAHWASQRVRRWPLLGLMLGSLLLVASYSFYCRFRLTLLPSW